MGKIYYVVVKFDDEKNVNAQRDARWVEDWIVKRFDNQFRVEMHEAQKGMALQLKAV